MDTITIYPDFVMTQSLPHKILMKVTAALIYQYVVAVVDASDGFETAAFGEDAPSINPRFKFLAKDFTSFAIPEEFRNQIAIDQPTNGFWPNPKAIQEIYRPKSQHAQRIDEGKSHSRSPSARILIHHADAQNFETSSFPVCGDTCSKMAWEIHPSGGKTTDTDTSLPVESLLLMPPSSTTKLPLEVVVRLVYGTRDRQNSTSAVRGTSAAELPSFLTGASNDVIRKYFEITNNPTLTKGDVKNALKRWKLMLSTDLLEKYDEVQVEKAQKLAEEHDRQSQRISSLSVMAKQVAEQIEAIRSNDGLTMAEEEYLIGDIMQSIPDDVRAELISL
ncbi:unnamed protein product [Angiostrongylus costaricensis]|uniref:DUF148 domain-containing protein n=1 Tax=Angiostrongylus costaricensis TaxID=334426 RepID=A0A158PDA2_ANGCS|nr:unnamed protein product [Angiostrongylus costaricensis]